MTDPRTTRHPGWEMFALSFTALFLEMMVIRWVPSVVHLVAYYANLMLLSSFLGIGAGALASGRCRSLLGLFPVFLAADVGLLILDRNAVLGTSASEAHFFALPPSMFHAATLVWIFAMNALLFVPLGQRMGVLFGAMPRLTAYAWDLAGSLAGTLCFGVFSLRLFSPVLGMAAVMALYLVLSRRRLWWLDAAVLGAALFAVVRFSDPNAIWSPYYYITVQDYDTPTVSVAAPPADLLTRRDPPLYRVSVNQFGYHYDADLNPARYTGATQGAKDLRWLALQYGLPYKVGGPAEKVLVVGAGGGFDVEAALAAGAQHVDAVEIDPVIIAISRRFNAGAPYANPRVSVHLDDARSYLAKAGPGYDRVVFGFLDSQALFSTMNNVRLDGYVYTVESMRTAFGLLSDRGVLTLSFYLGRPWLGPKLYQLVKAATGREPALYLDDSTGRTLIICVPRDPSQALPLRVGPFHRAAYPDIGAMSLPTDDWPFLYLIGRTVPSDYLIAIGSLLAFSVLVVLLLRGTSLGRGDAHFGLLGMGFLLLETKSIGDCTLYFGTTWFVTLLVVAGVLAMVIAANLASLRIRAFTPWMYAPLFLTLALLLLVPRGEVLGLGFGARVAWTLLVVPLPVFFAGIVFSTTFRDAADASAAFGANLLGAMVGGFCEYLSMAIGSQRLSMLIMAAYLGSLLMVTTLRRPAAGSATG
jgi:hypothetical protein